MDSIINSKLGKLKIICSLPLFSDSICIKKQSAAEHGYTQVMLSAILAPHLKLSLQEECELIELAIFAELPKVFLGDPSFYLRQRHPEFQELYHKIRAKVWQETEQSLGIVTSRCSTLYGLHELVDAYASMLYLEKEYLLGNQFFAADRATTFTHKKSKALAGEDLAKPHPCALVARQQPVQWPKAIQLLDQIFTEATAARVAGGISEYSTTFLGMVEKLKEHFRYKGWNYHYKESVGEHTFQVVFLCRLVAEHLQLSLEQKITLYHTAVLHDLAEAYASDVIYPIKMREKELGQLHHKIEEDIIAKVCERFQLRYSQDAFIKAVVKICDCFSAQIYFDREQRSGNTLFNFKNMATATIRDKYAATYPEVFTVLDALWNEYTAAADT